MRFCANRLQHLVLVCLVTAAIVLSSCSPSSNQATTPVAPLPSPMGEDSLYAAVDFNVTLPDVVPSNQKLSIEVLDEVTGLALNSIRYPMKRTDDTHYTIQLPVPVGSVVKYRYIREGGIGAIEYTSQARQVRYRMFYTINPAVVEDIVSGWNDKPFTGNYGRIQGMIVEDAGNTPLAGMLVAAGGQQTISASNGSFLLDGLPPGKHNLVIYSLDGSFPPFQQEAVVAAESSTPANIRISPAHLVNVTFVVKSPSEIPEGIPLRLIGNTYPLGNTFADLRGGISTVATRAPLMGYQKDRQYVLKLQLPTGLDLRYKYTLGDGFWNAERDTGGKFHVRQLIVPANDIEVHDDINTFTTAGVGAVTFNLDAAAGTAKDEVVSIQFNPYGWTEPIPMWPLGDNQWIYILYTPLDGDILANPSYRYCKNDQCGILDDASTSGQDTEGKQFKPVNQPQVLKDTVKQWAWAVDDSATITVPSDPISRKPEGFVAGVELLPGYHPSWQTYLGNAFMNIHDLEANWVVLSPTWHFTSANPPVLAQVQGVDPSWYDLSQMGIQAKNNGLKIAVYPSTAYYQPAEIWWKSAARDANWWQSWYDRYETFILNHADFANQSGAEALILGDELVASAFPGGKLMDNSPAGVPKDVQERWVDLIKKIRARYKGKIIWRLNYPVSSQGIPEFVKEVDLIYLVVNGQISDQENPDASNLQTKTAQLFENDIRLLRDKLGKPFLIGISYPSVNGAATGCVKNGDACMPSAIFNQAGLELPSLNRNLSEQANIYNAILAAVSKADWIRGVIASGYFPAISVQDKSKSIRGKPAGDVVWFWFDHFLKSGK
jgi:hypothetical protein